jgi:hypothetical protein
MYLRRSTSLAAVVGLEIAALRALHHLGSYEPAAIAWGDLNAWLAQTPPEDALVAAVRLAALGLAWWLTASTVLYLLASATRIPYLVRGVRWATIAPVRRMIDGALATTIVFGSTITGTGTGVPVAAPAVRGAVVIELDQPAEQAAEEARPPYHPRPAGDAGPNSYEPRPANDPPPRTATLPSRTDAASPENERATVPTTATYTVRPGDNFWTIAEQHLAVARDHPSDELDTDNVRAYWLRLVQANAGDLASNDPDLIWPGEQIELP